MIALERFLEILMLGLKNLLRNRLRSFLTMLGIIFGVGSVIAMLSIGAGARQEILDRIGELGVRNIIVNSIKPPEEKKADDQTDNVLRYGLKFEDLERIKETCATVTRALPVNVTKERVWYGSKRVDASVTGILPEQLEMFRLDVRSGRPFNEIDSIRERKVCIIRRSLSREFGIIGDPLGETIRVGSYPFQVVGVLEDGRGDERAVEGQANAGDVLQGFLLGTVGPHAQTAQRGAERGVVNGDNGFQANVRVVAEHDLFVLRRLDGLKEFHRGSSKIHAFLWAKPAGRSAPNEPR